MTTAVCLHDMARPADAFLAILAQQLPESLAYVRAQQRRGTF